MLSEKGNMTILNIVVLNPESTLFFSVYVANLAPLPPRKARMFSCVKKLYGADDK